MKARNETITQDHLKELLEYDPETGRFTWLKKPNKYSNIKIGTVADKFHAGYNDISINNKRYKSHRLVWLYLYGEFPADLVDHIDGDTLNNRPDNLRLATKSSNNWNRICNTNSSTGVKGVRLHKSGKYEARLMCNGISYYLGVFITLEEAKNAVAAKREDLHKEFTNHG